MYIFQLKYDKTPEVSEVPDAILADLHRLSLPAHACLAANPDHGSNHPPSYQPAISSDHGDGEYLELMGPVPYIDTPASPRYNLPKPTDEEKREILKIR